MSASKSDSSFALYRGKFGTLTWGVIPFVLIQACVLFVFTTHFSWFGLGLCMAMYFSRMFLVTGVYHRYFSHKSYKMGRVTQFIMALLATTVVQKGPLWWAAHHRHHHAFSDKEEDLHSPKKGFWVSHLLWFLTAESNDVDYRKVNDFAKYPEIRFIEKFWWVPPTALGVGMFLAWGWHVVVWGFFVSTFLLQHGTYTINSLSHLFGNQRYHSGDTSRNNWFLAIVTLGEGWHNNHHKYMSSARNGFFWWEYDITYYIIKVMSWLGLAHDLKPVPMRVLEEGRENDKLRSHARRQGKSWVPPVPESVKKIADKMPRIPTANTGGLRQSADLS